MRELVLIMQHKLVSTCTGVGWHLLFGNVCSCGEDVGGGIGWVGDLSRYYTTTEKATTPIIQYKAPTDYAKT